MAWQAVFLDASKRDGVIVVTIGYVNGAQRFSREYTVAGIPDSPDEYVRQLAIAEVAAITAGETAKAKFTLTRNTVLDLTPTPPPSPTPPTQAELDRAQFFADVNAWRQQQALAALPADLQARCLPEYLAGL